MVVGRPGVAGEIVQWLVGVVFSLGHAHVAAPPQLLFYYNKQLLHLIIAFYSWWRMDNVGKLGDVYSDLWGRYPGPIPHVFQSGSSIRRGRLFRGLKQHPGLQYSSLHQYVLLFDITNQGASHVIQGFVLKWKFLSVIWMYGFLTL